MKNNGRQPAEANGDMVSIIAPVYNEIENIDTFYTRLEKVCAAWNRRYEIIFVDDGSSDGTTEYLRNLPSRNPAVRVIRFARNFGQENAIIAGVDHARGDIIQFIDVDLQVIPEDIPRLIEKIDEGYELVVGVRPRREESLLLRKIPSKFANYVFRNYFHLPYKDLGCSIQAIRKKLFDGVEPFSMLYTYRVLYAGWRGSKYTDIPVTYNPRVAGVTKYKFFSLLNFFLNLMLTFTLRQNELVFFFLAGSLSAGLGITGLIVQAAISIGGYSFRPALFTSSLFLIFSGLVLFLFGTINERLNRISHQINKTPVYVIAETWDASSTK